MNKLIKFGNSTSDATLMAKSAFFIHQILTKAEFSFYNVSELILYTVAVIATTTIQKSINRHHRCYDDCAPPKRRVASVSGKPNHSGNFNTFFWNFILDMKIS